MSTTKNVYVGDAKKIGEDGMSINICLSELFDATKNDADVKAKIFTSEKTGKKYLRLSVWPKKEEHRQKHSTHSVKVDLWEPEQKSQTGSGLPKEPVKSDDLPF